MRRLTLRLLGLPLLTLTLEDDNTGGEQDAPPCLTDLGATTSYPVGYAPPAGDQRWETGVDYQ